MAARPRRVRVLTCVAPAISPALSACSRPPRSTGWTSCGSGPLFLAMRNCSLRELTVGMAFLPPSALVAAGNGEVSSGCSLPVRLPASPTAPSRAASPCRCSGCMLVLPSSSRTSSSGIALPSGCARVGPWTAPVWSCRVACPLRLGVARPLCLSIGPRLPFPHLRFLGTQLQVQRGVRFDNQPRRMLLELLCALGRGLDHQQVRIVSRPLHVYKINLRVHAAPLRQCGQNRRRSIANHVTLVLRLHLLPLWWPLYHSAVSLVGCLCLDCSPCAVPF